MFFLSHHCNMRSNFHLPCADSIADSQKSTGQKLSDSTRGNADSAQDQGKGVLGQAQETLGNAAQSVSDTLSGQNSECSLLV